MPETLNEFIWYIFGGLGAYFLWSIKSEITGLRQDIRAEQNARGLIEQRIAEITARCAERHKV